MSNTERAPGDAHIRDSILRQVREYFDAVHRPRIEAGFSPGIDRINYAGRVYDAEELVNLVDSALEFWLTAGRYSKGFERSLAAWLGVRYTLLVNSGSSANLLAFQALTSPYLGDRRIRQGDEVITVAAGFPTTVTPAIQFGAVPVFVDINVEDGTYNVDCGQLEEAWSERSRLVMIAHTMGNPFDIESVQAFCRDHQLWLIEDNCDALGARFSGQLTGTFGDLGTSSFYPAHHITTGEGGAVYTNNSLLKRAAESIRDWGRDCWCAPGKDNTCGKRFEWSLGELPFGYDHKYIYSHLGYNLKATESQAAVGCAQLDKLDGFVVARRANWNFLRDALADLEEFFILPNATPKSEPSWFGFVLSIREGAPFSRQQLTAFLESRNIQTRMLFAGNLTRHPAFDELRAADRSYRTAGPLRNTDYIADRTFWLGVYPGMKQLMLEYTAQSIREFVLQQ